MPDFLKGKSLEELAEICQYAAQACQAATAAAEYSRDFPILGVE